MEFFLRFPKYVIISPPMKRLFFVFLVAISVVSCLKEGDAPHSSTPPVVKISTVDNGKNIFELMKFSFFLEKSESGVPDRNYGFRIEPYYDSLVWRVPALKADFKVFEPDRWYTGVGTCFFLPGTHRTLLSGYKDGKVVYSYEYPVTVRSDKDFLGYDWEEITGPDDASTGYKDIFAADYTDCHFSSYAGMHDDVPSVTLFIWFTDDDFSAEKEKNRLLDEIRNLYGEADYSEADGELESVYNSSFHYREEGAQPLYVWLTEKSNIVLLGKENHHLRYVIYAEPV